MEIKLTTELIKKKVDFPADVYDLGEKSTLMFGGPGYIDVDTPKSICYIELFVRVPKSPRQ